MRVAHPALEEPEYYVPGLSRDWVAGRYGIPVDEVAKLGSAENPLGPSPRAVEAVRQAVARLHRYPSWTAEPLRTAVASTFDVDPDRVVLGAGETEVISLVLRAFSEVGSEVLMPRPCFPIYHLFAEAEGRRVTWVDTVGQALDVEAYLAAITDDTRIVFVTNPHSPSGTWLAEDDVRRIVAAAPRALVVLDEAYVHYSQTPGYLHLVHDHPNLAVLRTFSKAYGLAGLRIGYGVAAPEVVAALLAVKPTWNLGQLQVAGGVAALADTGHVEATVELVVANRERVVERLGALDRFRVVPGSRANFFLLEVVDDDLDSTAAFEGLLERGVIVKDGSVSFRGLGRRFLRIDVNHAHHMDHLVDALADLP